MNRRRRGTRRPAVAVGSDGCVYAALEEVEGERLLAVRAAVVRGELPPQLFVGVVVPGLDVGRLLERLDDRAAEVVAIAVGRQRRRRTARRS